MILRTPTFSDIFSNDFFVFTNTKIPCIYHTFYFSSHFNEFWKYELATIFRSEIRETERTRERKKNDHQVLWKMSIVMKYYFRWKHCGHYFEFHLAYLPLDCVFIWVSLFKIFPSAVVYAFPFIGGGKNEEIKPL